MPYNSLCDFVQIVGSPSGIKVMTVRYFTGYGSLTGGSTQCGGSEVR